MSDIVTEVKWGLILLEDNCICCFTVTVLSLWESKWFLMCLGKCFPNWCFQQKEKGPATLSYRSVHHLFMHIPKKLKVAFFCPVWHLYWLTWSLMWNKTLFVKSTLGRKCSYLSVVLKMILAHSYLNLILSACVMICLCCTFWIVTSSLSFCRLQFTVEFCELHTHSTVNGSASLSELHSPVGFYFNVFYFSCKLRKQIMCVSKKLHWMVTIQFTSQIMWCLGSVLSRCHLF